ncbi:uncharacterized protein DS421_17g571980 [Arachis hypogaea]|nr:uncharacterized protein DS421_17g571980 [Arachis hypogaea]
MMLTMQLLYRGGDNGGASTGYDSASGDFPSSSNEHHTQEIVKTNQPAQTKSKKKKKVKDFRFNSRESTRSSRLDQPL